MIRSWRHKGLQQFYQTGTLKWIQAQHKPRLTIILQYLDAAVKPDDMALPGMYYHKLKGNRRGSYAVTVQTNWRVVFTFIGKHAMQVDYLDYH